MKLSCVYACLTGRRFNPRSNFWFSFLKLEIFKLNIVDLWEIKCLKFFYIFVAFVLVICVILLFGSSHNYWYYKLIGCKFWLHNPIRILVDLEFYEGQEHLWEVLLVPHLLSCFRLSISILRSNMFPSFMFQSFGSMPVSVAFCWSSWQLNCSSFYGDYKIYYIPVPLHMLI